MELLKLESTINKLVEDIGNAEQITTNELLKSKVSFQLTKIHFGLKLISRVMKLFAIQESIEDRLLREEEIKDLSIRELLVMSSVNSKRIDNYYGKIDKILGSLKLNELENSLIMINEFDTKRALNSPSEGQSDLTALSLKLLNTITEIQSGRNAFSSTHEDAVIVEPEDEDDNDGIPQSIDFTSGDFVDEELEAERVVNRIESIGSTGS